MDPAPPLNAYAGTYANDRELDADDTLRGDLILAAAGDLTLGGRLNADGTIAFTDFDYNDANNLGTAILTPQDPLSGRPRLVQTFRIENPTAYARKTFIQALRRTGMTVAAPTLGLNPAWKLPPGEPYSPATRFAEFVSPPYAEYAKLIRKVSLNLGANLSLMPYGLTRGRQVAFALFVNDAGPIESISDVSEVFENEAAITSAIYEMA